MQPVAKPVDMKKRQREQQAIRARDLPGVKKCDSVGREIVVREHSALGSARGPRCIDDPRGSFARQGNLRTPVRESGGLSGQVRVGQDSVLSRQAGGLRYADSRRGIVEDVCDLAIAIEDVDRHENQTQLDRGQINIDHLDAVGQINAHAISRLEPARQEQVCQAIAARVEIAEGIRSALEFERDSIAPAEQRWVKKF